MDAGSLIDRVAAVLREVAAEVIEPRFEHLADGDVKEKAPKELVTVADTDSERALTRRLGELLPGVPVVGEEATSTDGASPADVLSRAPRAWLVDPVDGTWNFVSGSPDWGVMAALVERGRPIVSWIWRPVDRRMYVAERGAGAWVDAHRLIRQPAPADPAHLRGGVLRRYLDDATLEKVDANAGRFEAITTERMAAAIEYPLIAEGEQDFALFGRTLPWDHAPGVLLVEEAGGVGRRPDGTPYRPAEQSGNLLVAADEATWHVVRDRLLG